MHFPSCLIYKASTNAQLSSAVCDCKSFTTPPAFNQSPPYHPPFAYGESEAMTLQEVEDQAKRLEGECGRIGKPWDGCGAKIWADYWVRVKRRDEQLALSEYSLLPIESQRHEELMGVLEEMRDLLKELLAKSAPPA